MDRALTFQRPVLGVLGQQSGKSLSRPDETSIPVQTVVDDHDGNRFRGGGGRGSRTVVGWA